MLLTLTTKPTLVENDFFITALTEQDALLITGSALPLLFGANPTIAKGYVLKREADKLGANESPTWEIISDEDWLALIENHDKNVTW